MWFFGNSKSLGFIFELVGLIMLITSVLYITEGYAEVGISLPPTVSDVSSYCLLIGFGGLVASIIYIVNAHRIMIGTVSKKVDVLSKYIVTVGITTFFASGAEYLASYLYDREPYDIWFIITAHEVTTTTNSNDSSLSDYYQMLAYQNYYNSMYGGYGGYGYGGYGYGYGGYGYGGYGGYGYDPYTNYYSYMMMAQYANQSSTSTTATDVLDKDRYYCGLLYGPRYSDASLRPKFKLTFSVANTE